MFVRDRMSSPAITVAPDTPFPDALQQMRDHRFRRLPVVDAQGKLVGIVSERDLLHAAPSPATSLTIWEVHYLLAKLKVKEIMTRDVITTTPDTPVEDAAQLMVTHKIGGLPVIGMDKDVVGVITETDIFETFVEMFGGGHAGVRLALEVPERKGVLASLALTIRDLGGRIESIGTFCGKVNGQRRIVIRVRDLSKSQLVEKIEALGNRVVDARDV